MKLSVRKKFDWIISFIWLNKVLILVTFFVLSCFFLYTQTKAPSDFPLNTPIVIADGISAAAASDSLREANVVRSSTLLYVTFVLGFDPSSIKSGTYTFTDEMSVFEVAARVTAAAPPSELVSLTLPEGYTNHEFAVITKKILPDFNVDLFTELTMREEGYIFPDTYYLTKDFSENKLYSLLKNSYQEKTSGIRYELENSALTEHELITLASIIEREANTKESMEIVAGILLARLEIGMPLQVDASMEYIIDKPLQDLTAADLEIDSPYNTYLYKGLPPTPIGNPGLTAINAILYPKVTEYLYYITDDDGNFYYAKTFDEHKANIVRYLR